MERGTITKLDPYSRRVGEAQCPDCGGTLRFAYEPSRSRGVKEFLVCAEGCGFSWRPARVEHGRPPGLA